MPPDLRIIPRHEPEVVAAGARRYVSGDEKVATTSIKSLTVDGVKVESRYDKANELELMRALVLDLPDVLRNSVVSIFDDSKMGNLFIVVLREWTIERARMIGQTIAASAMARSGGYNGINVVAQDQKDPDNIFGNSSSGCFDIGGDWGEDITPGPDDEAIS